MSTTHRAGRLIPVLFAPFLLLVTVGPALAHEQRDVAGYHLVVGMIAEPVFAGQKSGLEFMISKDDEPVVNPADGPVAVDLKAEVTIGGTTKEIPVTARFGAPGWYQSYFFPTLAGAYNFHLFGTISGTPIDERFEAKAEGVGGGYGQVRELAAGQFPVSFPSDAEMAADVRTAVDASGQLPLALGLGAIGALLGLVALGISLAGRRRAA